MELSEIYRNLSNEEIELLNRIIKKYGANHWEVGKAQFRYGVVAAIHELNHNCNGISCDGSTQTSSMNRRQ